MPLRPRAGRPPAADLHHDPEQGGQRQAVAEVQQVLQEAEVQRDLLAVVVPDRFDLAAANTEAQVVSAGGRVFEGVSTEFSTLGSCRASR